MADLDALRAAREETALRHAPLVDALAEAAAQLAAERKQRDLLRRQGAGPEALAEADARVSALLAARRERSAALGALHDEFAGSLEQLLGDELELEGSLPLALLPVRVEVRSTPDQATLRVRIFPDAVHGEALDEGLKDDERRAGIAYWEEVWKTGDAEAPWPTLVTAVGTRRAPWVAEALRPSNLAERPAGEPAIPDTPPSAPPVTVARTLPDRFHVRVEQDGAEPVTVHARPIPDELPIGLTDVDRIDPLTLDEHDLPPLDASLRWLVDYGEAERLGMAVTVPLPVPGQDVERLLVYGVRAALDPAGGATRIEQLLRAHRFTDGAEFVPQGTPTNNTESVRSEWSRRTPPGPPDLAGADRLGARTNGAVTAAALGLDPALLATLPAAAEDEQGRAAAFNTALWATTWGDAIEHLTPEGRANSDKRLDTPTLDALREHWIGHVRGRGPLPALRLGRQPYGLLPLIPPAAALQPQRGNFAEARLAPFLRERRWMWEDAAAAVPTVMDGALDEVLPEILGTDATLRGLRVRSALSPDPVLWFAIGRLFGEIPSRLAQQQITGSLGLLAGVGDEAVEHNFLTAKKTRSLALPLVHPTDGDFIFNLLETNPAPAPHRSVLQVLLAHADEVSRHAVESIAPREALDGIFREAISATRTDVEPELVTGALEAVRAGAFDDGLVADAAGHIADRLGPFDARILADRHPIPALAPPTVVQQIAGEQPRLEALRGQTGMRLVGELFRTAGRRAAFQEALRTIAGIASEEERRLLLAETLDCCSHRLDAWIVSIASRRLADLRARGAKGVFLGAYGWLENIALQTPDPAGQIDERDVLHDPGDGGYVHAPGLTHAATAGVLRSGRLTHRRGDAADTALDIDLSSTRTRDAVSLLDGMRRGQSLGALLGYRLERRLHERSGEGLELDRFIFVLRTLAPLRGAKLTAPDQSVQEGLAASDVVDGLKLMQLPTEAVTAKLVSGPEDPRYIPAGEWNAPQGGEEAEVLAAITELKQTHDAVADLLLAESVHQLVSGNPGRAAAVLDVLGAGEAVPPEPGVVATPRTGVPIQHRVAIVVPETLRAAVAGWDTAAPRAQAEPRLEAWAQGALGDPAQIVFVDEPTKITLADQGLSALDVIYDADGDTLQASSLAARLRPQIEHLDDHLAPLAPTWALAGMLRALLLAGRPLDIADLGRPVEDRAVGRLPDAAELLTRATNAKDALRVAAAAPDPIAALAAFGVRPPPAGGPALSAEEQAAANVALVEEAQRRADAAERLLARAAPPEPPEPPEAAETPVPASLVELGAQALTAVFGAGFVAAPLLGTPPAGERDLWAEGVGPDGVRARPGADIRPWLARAGTLRAASSAYGEALLVRDALGLAARLRVVQTPVAAYGSWVGLPFPEARPPMVPIASLVAEVTGATAEGPDPDLSGVLAGIVIDEWTEVVPRRLERHRPDAPDDPPELVDVTTTGVALHANAPGARPPQAILLALSPDGQPWNADRLVDVLGEALALARIRGVTLQQVPFAGRYLPALYFRDWSLQGEPVISWPIVAKEFDPSATLTFVKVEQ
jgi:hypothetical protein